MTIPFAGKLLEKCDSWSERSSSAVAPETAKLYTLGSRSLLTRLRRWVDVSVSINAYYCVGEIGPITQRTPSTAFIPFAVRATTVFPS